MLFCQGRAVRLFGLFVVHHLLMSPLEYLVRTEFRQCAGKRVEVQSSLVVARGTSHHPGVVRSEASVEVEVLRDAWAACRLFICPQSVLYGQRAYTLIRLKLKLTKNATLTCR